MKNSHGLVRSPEFMKAHPEAAPKVHHLRVTPHLKGVKVTHHTSLSGPAFATHHFSKEEGPELADHIMEHTGGALSSEGGGEDYADEHQEREEE